MYRSIRKLETQLNEIEEKLIYLNWRVPVVSAVSVGWHLAHNMIVINSVLKGLKHSDLALYKKSFSWKKELVFLTGVIPRGKAKAPGKTRPEENLSKENLERQLQQVKNELKNFLKLPENSFFEHPYFGHIKKPETPRFLVIHTEHHLKIVRDIIRHQPFRNR